MKYEERKKAARNRIRELLLLISEWDETELDKQISVGNYGKTNYDPENIDNVKYLEPETSFRSKFAYNNNSRALTNNPQNTYADPDGVGLDFQNQGTTYTAGQVGHVDINTDCFITADADLT